MEQDSSIAGFSLNSSPAVIGSCHHCAKPVMGPMRLHEWMAAREEFEK
jgi:hypothetical protein